MLGYGANRIKSLPSRNSHLTTEQREQKTIWKQICRDRQGREDRALLRLGQEGWQALGEVLSKLNHEG